MAHYDGEGNLTLVDHIVLNGVPPEPAEEWRPGSGTILSTRIALERLLSAARIRRYPSISWWSIMVQKFTKWSTGMRSAVGYRVD
jgi:hypothetical protein